MPINRNKISELKSGYFRSITKIYKIGLDNISISIFNYLCSCTEDFNPSITRISNVLQISRTTVVKYIKVLESRNIIRIAKVGGRHTPTIYEFVHPEEWK